MIAQFSLYALDLLLISTLIYLMVLMKRLKAFHAHEKEMRKIVTDIATSTENARDVMAKLKMASFETQSSVDEQLAKAKVISDDLDRRTRDVKETMRLLAESERTTTSRAPAPRHERSGKAEPFSGGGDAGVLDDLGDMTKFLRSKLAAVR